MIKYWSFWRHSQSGISTSIARPTWSTGVDSERAMTTKFLLESRRELLDELLLSNLSPLISKRTKKEEIGRSDTSKCEQIGTAYGKLKNSYSEIHQGRDELNFNCETFLQSA